MLLKTEGVCYLPSRGKVDSTAGKSDAQKGDRCTVPMVRIISNEDVSLLLNQYVMIQVQSDGEVGVSKQPLLLEGF